jgi:hypothetical protein
VIGTALLASARGVGHLQIAADLDRPPGTVRRWVRAVRGAHTEWLRTQAVEQLAALDRDECLADKHLCVVLLRLFNRLPNFVILGLAFDLPFRRHQNLNGERRSIGRQDTGAVEVALGMVNRLLDDLFDDARRAVARQSSADMLFRSQPMKLSRTEQSLSRAPASSMSDALRISTARSFLPPTS